MNPAPLPPVPLSEAWTLTAETCSQTMALLRMRRGDEDLVLAEIQRCGAGRLRHAYPVSSHDIEVRIRSAVDDDLLTDVLTELTTAIETADPRCRRIVFAAAPDDCHTLAAAEKAGFRRVVDIDLRDAELSLLVAEPDWVTAVDPALDRVPGT